MDKHCFKTDLAQDTIIDQHYQDEAIFDSHFKHKDFQHCQFETY